jgi:hypothetical protein
MNKKWAERKKKILEILQINAMEIDGYYYIRIYDIYKILLVSNDKALFEIKGGVDIWGETLKNIVRTLEWEYVLQYGKFYQKSYMKVPIPKFNKSEEKIFNKYSEPEKHMD